MRSFLIAIAGITASIGAARAEFSLYPLRQVLTENAPAAQFVVTNPSPRIIHGRVTWIDLEATEDGYRKAPPALRQKVSAAPYLTLSPATFRLKPGERVEITVRLRKDSAPPRGERRSHLLVQSEASRAPVRRASQGGLEVDIALGASAPVIIRTGFGGAGAKIDGTRLTRGADNMLTLRTMIESTGEFSAYGEVTARFHPTNEPSYVIATMGNVASYIEAPSRQIALPLNITSFPPGELELIYEGRAEYAGRIFARRKYQITPPAPKGDATAP